MPISDHIDIWFFPFFVEIIKPTQEEEKINVATTSPPPKKTIKIGGANKLFPTMNLLRLDTILCLGISVYFF